MDVFASAWEAGSCLGGVWVGLEMEQVEGCWKIEENVRVVWVARSNCGQYNATADLNIVVKATLSFCMEMLNRSGDYDENSVT